MKYSKPTAFLLLGIFILGTFPLSRSDQAPENLAPQENSPTENFTLDNSVFENFDNTENSSPGVPAQPGNSPPPCENSDPPAWPPLKPFAGEGWSYRRPVTITNPGAALENYQVRVELDTVRLIAENKMQANGADLRFSWENAETGQVYELPYWIESLGGPPENIELTDYVARWRFDETSDNVAHDETGAHNGIVTGGAWVQDGPRNCLELANGYVLVENNREDFQITGPLTLSAWVYVAGYPANPPAYYGILSKGCPGEFQLILEYTGRLYFGRGAGGGFYCGTLPLNSWNHLAITSDSSSTCFYLNGALESTYSGLTGTSTANALCIGCYDPSGVYPFTGRLDEVHIYGRTLNPREVRALHGENVPAEENVPSKIWVRVPMIPANENTIIYARYGNPNAPPAENGDAVFEFFDGFSGENVDDSKWGTHDGWPEGGWPGVKNGIMTCDGSATLYGVYSRGMFAPPTVLRFRAKMAPANYSMGGFWGVYSYAYYVAAYYRDGHVAYVTPHSEAFRYPAGDWYKYELRRENDRQRWYLDDVWNTTQGYSIPAPAYIIFYSHSGGRIDVDWVLIRGYADPEPAAVVGEEEGAEKLVRVAVILAEPRDIEHENLRDEWDAATQQFIRIPAREWFRRRSAELVSYYDEVSYGALVVRLDNRDIYDNGGEWYKLGRDNGFYRIDKTFGIPAYSYGYDFIRDAVVAADADVRYDLYDIVIVVGATGPLAMNTFDYWWHGRQEQIQLTADNVELKNLVLTLEIDGVNLWAHEVGHGLGAFLTGTVLPGLNPWDNISAGNVDGWDVMGPGTPYGVHLCSWSKERLGWLEYEPVDWVKTGKNYWENWVDALPTLDYGSKVYDHLVFENWRLTIGRRILVFQPIEYLLEVRTNDEKYSRWDIGVPGTGLVMYKVDSTAVLYRDNERVLAFSEKVNVAGNPPFNERNQPPPTEGGIQFMVSKNESTPDTYRMRISAQKATENQLWFIMRQVPISLSENATLLDMTSQWPDLDLHAYTYDGRHVGMNYETGEYEIEIEGALASGDYFNGSEWIRLPAGVEACFTTSSHDVAEFLASNPGAQLEFENGLCAVGSRYHDNLGERYESTPVGQMIEPGTELFNELEIVQNPDGTYSVEVEQGMNLLSLEAWRGVIDNLPDNVFTQQPSQRKNALKNKLEAVFRQVEENNYNGAIDKLANDILKKLDADGEADWVKEPVLVAEIKAFIAMLRYKAGGGGG